MRKSATKYPQSIMQTKCECYFCHKTYDLDRHHSVPGNGNRKICEELGLWVWLCRKCHDKVHDKLEGYKELQIDAQRAFIKDQRAKGFSEEVAREIWYSRFLKFYD